LKNKYEKSKQIDDLIQKITETAPAKGEKIIPKQFEQHEILTDDLRKLTDNNIITASKFTD